MASLIKQLLKARVPSPLEPVFNKLVLRPLVKARMLKAWNRVEPTDWPLPECCGKQGIEKYEYSLFSQNGEDGILRYLFDEIGFSSRLFLEFGFDVRENDSLRLVMKEGFSGVYIDGSEIKVRYFNEAARSFGITNARAINAFLNLENLESVIIESGLGKEIDLLSIDVDGNDYWFWEAIRCLSARIVVIEYNASLGPELSLTVPYDPVLDRHQKHPSGFYHGASLTALERLGRKKDFKLIGCDSSGVNAFFIREDFLTDNLNVLSPQSAFRPHRSRLEDGFSVEDQYRMIKDLPFVTIE